MPESNALQILCPFCNAVQSAKIEAELEGIHEGCTTCGYGRRVDMVVEVSCESCNKVIYRKECSNE